MDIPLNAARVARSLVSVAAGLNGIDLLAQVSMGSNIPGSETNSHSGCLSVIAKAIGMELLKSEREVRVSTSVVQRVVQLIAE